MAHNPRHKEIFSRGLAPALVEAFSIIGLHGYRNVSLTSPYSATILIAKNGSGKTTLLGALDAILKRQFFRLKELRFSEIRCRLRGLEREIILKQEDIIRLADIPDDSDVSRLARRLEIEPASLFQFLSEEYEQIRDSYRALSDEPIYAALERSVGYRRIEATGLLDKARLTLFDHSPNIVEIDQSIKSAMNGTEILYLPTYRRVEIPFSGDANERTSLRRRKQRFRFPSSIFTGDIQFGLSDIAERLAELNQEILVNSNRGYREISAGIINELIDGTFERDDFDSDEIPSKDELKLFFSRLKEGRRVGPFNEVSVPNIDKIYTGDDIPLASNKFLRYFLNKLNTVIKATRDIEAPVEAFIANCNKYLSYQDLSASLPAVAKKEAQPGLDDKALRLDRRSFKVYAESIASGRKISLDALSSGEKQMISLFAKLILYPRNKIVLIDEPELSLSLDWQKQILPDVVDTPLCVQVIAITHSPFVFDNALEPFARSLHLAIESTASEAALDDDGVELGE